MEIKEHDPKEIEKGIHRLGREFKSRPVDITNRLKDLELVPCWKQTGGRPDTDNETELWLWDKVASTKYGLIINPKFKDYWYICLDGRNLGIINIESDHTYVFNSNAFVAFHCQYKSDSKNDALAYCLKVHSEGHQFR